MNTETRWEKRDRLVDVINTIRTLVVRNPNCALVNILKEFGVARNVVIDGLKYVGALSTEGPPSNTTYSWHSNEPTEDLADKILKRATYEIPRANPVGRPQTFTEFQLLKIIGDVGPARHGALLQRAVSYGYSERTFNRRLEEMVRAGKVVSQVGVYSVKKPDDSVSMPLNLSQKTELLEEHARAINRLNAQMAEAEKLIKQLSGWYMLREGRLKDLENYAAYLKSNGFEEAKAS